MLIVCNQNKEQCEPAKCSEMCVPPLIIVLEVALTDWTPLKTFLRVDLSWDRFKNRPMSKQKVTSQAFWKQPCCAKSSNAKLKGVMLALGTLSP